MMISLAGWPDGWMGGLLVWESGSMGGWYQVVVERGGIDESTDRWMMGTGGLAPGAVVLFGFMCVSVFSSVP
jgi:hypothetical protein